MRTYGAAQLLTESVGVSPDDVFITCSKFKGRTGPSDEESLSSSPQPETK